MLRSLYFFIYDVLMSNNQVAEEILNQNNSMVVGKKLLVKFSLVAIVTCNILPIL